LRWTTIACYIAGEYGKGRRGRRSGLGMRGHTALVLFTWTGSSMKGMESGFAVG